MHKHPVKLHWKGENGTLRSELKRACEKQEKKSGPSDEEVFALCKSRIQEFVTEGEIFANLPARGKGITLSTEVTVDFKAFKIARDADEHRPLTLLRFNDGKQPVLLCRPDPKKPEGLVFKLVPRNGVLLVGIKEQFYEAVRKFNAPFAPEPPSSSKKYHPLNANRQQQLAAV